MKWLILLPASAVAFQSVAPIRRSTTSLNYYPKKFDRAEQCATHYGTCNLDELEKLADGEEGELQGHDAYKDTDTVYQMLRAQSELQHMIEGYVNGHHDGSLPKWPSDEVFDDV